MGFLNIKKFRFRSAILSGGVTSDKKLYDIFLKIIEENKISGDILDYGSGKGNLIKLLLEKRIYKAITGCDIIERPESRLLFNWIKTDLNNILNVKDASYDAIYSIETIEHLENPRFTSREWFRLLKPGGIILFSTPNNQSLRSILTFLFKGHFSSFLDRSYPAHITALLERDIIRILAESGFVETEIFYSDKGRVPKFTRLTWQQVSFNIFKGKLFSDNIIVKAKKPLR
jgi:2-polyprenyl-3-methyl-5-hydroxy-6-metoxy-1,4-benzoquinol methylase